MEKPAQMLKDRLQITAITSAIPLSIEKSFAHKTKKDLSKIKKPEQISIIIDYTKLHKYYLKLSKIKLTCMYTYTHTYARAYIQIIHKYI